MLEVRQTPVFAAWFAELRDIRARARIQVRLDRMVLGHLGDIRPVGKGVSEARIDYGPGYRLYFIRQGLSIVVLLCGGDKSSQDRDIKLAQSMARE
jgi:putative addiction module killer protein